MAEERRTTFRCGACERIQIGTRSKLFGFGWVRLSFRFSLAEKGVEGWMTEKRSSLRCPSCAPYIIEEHANQMTERYAKCGWQPREG
jgi:hypothetical protein